MTLQEGIYLERGSPPPPAWRLLLLDIVPGTLAADAAAALRETRAMLRELQRGGMRELADVREGETPATVPTSTFAALLGYGARFFDVAAHDPPLTHLPRPRCLVPLRSPAAGPAFPQIAWDADGAEPGVHGGEADLLLQLTGASQHAVARAAVEVVKLIAERRLPLRAAGTYDGFLRDDGRSWIGFHDGVSNVEPSQRAAAVTCPGDPGWMRGGTTLAFLRLQVALDVWRTLDRAAQEAIVGRDKLSGSPLVAVETDARGDLRPVPLTERAPAEATADGTGNAATSPDWQSLDAYRNPPETGDRLVEASHVHRVNQNRAAGSTRAGHRILRQGYEYLEDIGPDGPRLGLNFISFQSDIEHLLDILGLDGWLGDVNFGGPVAPRPGEPPPVRLLSLRAGGFYVVPPRAEPFPGAELFET